MIKNGERMADLIINIQTPGNMTLENTVIPGDYLNEHVIEANSSMS